MQEKLKQITLQGLAERKKPFPPDHPNAKEIIHRLAEMIAIDLQLFSVVEDIGFCLLMAILSQCVGRSKEKQDNIVVIPQVITKLLPG